jgi:hypothetical protein
VGEGQRDRARACPEIGHPLRRGGKPFQRRFHQQFGFWPRDEHFGRDFDLERPEFAQPLDVGQRFAGRAPRDAGPECFDG